MNTAAMTERITEASPRLKARIAGAFYLLTFLTGGAALFVRGRLGLAAGLIAGACYIAVTLLFYYIFKPVNRSLSLLAASISLAGCANGPLSLFHLVPFQINSLVFFGFYCLLIGYLIFRSTFLPRILGVLLAIDGVGWALFLNPTLAISLFPVIALASALAELPLQFWLLVMGVNEQRWKEQASAAGELAIVARAPCTLDSIAR